MERFRFFVRLFMAAALMALAPSAAWAYDESTVLLWMVYDNYDDPQIPDTGPDDRKFIDELRSRPDGYQVNGARLRVAGTDTYFSFFASEEDTPSSVLPIGADPQTGYFASAGPVYSYFGDYASSEYSFLIELGHWEGDEWLVMAASTAASYDELLDGGWTTDNPQNYPRQGPWAPTFTVPEPSGGLMMLLGASLLALRRRCVQFAVARRVGNKAKTCHGKT